MSQKGGPRPGAGRPPSGQPRLKGISVNFSEAQLTYIDAMVERDDVSRAAAVRRLVDWVMRNVKKEEL